MVTNTPRIDLRLSRESIADVEHFRKEMELTQKRTAELKQDLKQLKDLLKAVSAREIAIGRGGTGAFVEGSRFREARRVEATQRLATATAQTMEMQRQMLALSKQGLRFTENEARLRDAMNLNLRTQARTIERISNLKEAQNRLDSARVRLGLEAAEGNKSAVRSSQRIVELLERRVMLLRQEAQERAKAERSSARMADSQIAQRSRDLTLQRLFGDGGATLFGVQAGVLGNYMVMNGVRNQMSQAGQFTAGLDLAMRNLQAITVTTDGNMQDLRDTLIDISEETKFTAVDVANAAVTLGQAGLSTSEVKDAARAVTLLATATGTDLPRAVDIATSVLGVFNMESAQVATVADTMTEAVNSSKLNLEKLTLGLQYSGNIAAQLGLRFEELTAALGAMANSGIRSGSTLGTGMRQILISLMAPSGEFTEVLNRLGLTLADVDVRTQGLYGALANMRDAGFTAADAVRVFEVRAAAAYNALAGNLDQMIELETAFQGTAASTAANQTQMRAFSNQLARLGSVAGSVASAALEPMLMLLRDMISGFSDFLEVIRKYEGALQTLTSALVATGIVLASWRIARLAAGLVNLIGSTGKLSRSMGSLNRSIRTNNGLITGLTARYIVFNRWLAISKATVGRFGTMLRLAGGPIGMLITGIGLAAGAFMSFNAEGQFVSDTIDRAESAFDEAEGTMETFAKQVNVVNEEIQSLLNRYDRLSSDQRLLDAEIERVKATFLEMGLDITSVAEDVDGLIEQLRALRGELSEEYVAKIRVSVQELDLLRNTLAFQRESAVSDLRQSISNQMQIQERRGSGAGNVAGLVPLVSPFLQNGTSFDEARQGLVALKDAIFTRQQELENTRDTWRLNDRADVLQDEIRILEGVLEKAQTITETLGREQRFAGQADALRNREADARNALLPSVSGLSDRARGLRTGTTPRLQRAGTGFENDTLARYIAVQAEAAAIMAEQETLRSQLEDMVSRGQITQTNQNEILTLLNTVVGEVDTIVQPIADAAGKVEEALAASAVRQLQTKLRESQSALRSRSSGRAEVEAAMGDFGSLLEQYRAAREQQIEQTVSDVSLRDQAFVDLEAELATMQEAATRSYDDRLDQIATEGERARLTALQAEEDAANAAYDRAKELAEAAETLVERNKFLTEAMAALRRRMAATLSIIGIQLGDNPDAAAAATEEAETEFASDQSEVEDIRTSRLGRRGGGGSQQSALSRWTQAATNRITALTDLLENSGSTVAFEGIENTLDQARSRLDGLNGQIAAFEARMVSGNMSVQEQERLNELVSDQQKLQQLILNTEQQMIPLLYERGDIIGGIRMQVEQFAQQNLNLGQTLMDGLSGALGGLTNALAGFFTSWTDGTKKGKEAFADLTVSVLKSIQQIFAQMLAVQVLQTALGWFGFGISGGASLPSLIKLKEGSRGGVRNAAMGERVQGNLNRDSVPYQLMDGEYVLRRSAAQAIGYDNLDKMNSMGNRTTASSGHHGVMQQNKPSPAGDMNIYLVDERSQVGNLGPGDVLAIVTDDIARGGATKKLIKSVQMGGM